MNRLMLEWEPIEYAHFFLEVAAQQMGGERFESIRAMAVEMKERYDHVMRFQFMNGNVAMIFTNKQKE